MNAQQTSAGTERTFPIKDKHRAEQESNPYTNYTYPSVLFVTYCKYEPQLNFVFPGVVFKNHVLLL